MAVYKKPTSKFWWIDIYRGPSLPRVRVSSGTADRSKAQSIEAALRMAHRGDVRRDTIVSMVDDLLGHDEPVGIALVDAWEVYAGLPEVDVSEHTMAVRRGHFGRLVDYCAERWPRVQYLRDVGRDVAFAYADEVREASKTAKTYNAQMSNLQTIWKALTYRGGLAENVWSLVPKLAKKDSLHGRAFTRDEQKRILEVAKAFGDWHDISLVALNTGLRQGDILALTWDEVAGDELRIRPSKTERHGGSVIVPLHPVLVAMFASRPRTDPVFRDDRTKHRFPFTAILEEAQVEPSGAYLSFHCWRHTFRTRLAEANVPKDVVQKLGGWSTDISELYNHDTTALRAAILAMR